MRHFAPEKSWPLQRLGRDCGLHATLIGQRVGFPGRRAVLIRRNCLECAVILSDWLINDMVAAGTYI
jgi:hypothetical protein